MASNDDEERKYAIFRTAFDPETALALIEVVIEAGGAGPVATSLFQDRDPASDREANAALLRRAAEMLLERADMMLRPPPGRPSE
jgi:hypothetical protein